jgi:hypothetical protein
MGHELLRLLCALEKEKRSDVVMMLTHRYDMKVDPKIVAEVSEKFDVVVHVTTKRGNGWPEGPNAMFSDGYTKVVNMTRSGMKVSGVMFIECDCVPLAENWIDLIKAEWEEARKEGKLVLGPWLEKADANMRHINGNCVLSPLFWKECRGIFNCPPQIAWDAYHASAMMANAKPSRTIFSDYKLGSDENPWKGDADLWKERSYGAKENPLYGEKFKPCWLHGSKLMKGILAAKKRLLTK